MRIIDLRSDTVTQPSPAMREAMAAAVVGDDVFGEDPTVNALEERAAATTGKEAALFVVSGTMGNLVSLLTHCGRGDEVILGDQSHIFINEAGGMAALGGIQPHTLPNLPDGTLDLAAIASAVRADNIHFPSSRLLCLENTHNRCFGATLKPSYQEEAAALARRHGLRLHLDGARIFNASVALGVSVQELAAPFDSVTFCLSKGLAAPVGSLICGSRDFIKAARRIRKQVGGGMRQAGVLAAAGLVALTTMVDRLAEDHENARLLAAGLAEIPGLKVEQKRVETNIVYVDLIDPKVTAEDLLARLQRQGVLFFMTGKKRFRLLTHYGIERRDVLAAATLFREAMKST